MTNNETFSSASSFFNAFNPQFNHDHLIKTIIFNNLSENIKELQFDFKENGLDQLGLSDVTNSLCTIIEAIFLHGLKSTSVFRQTLIEIVTGPGSRDGDGGNGNLTDNHNRNYRFNNRIIGDRIPQPNFWAPLMIVSHKETIKQIQSLSQITTEIGCCRSWIRLTLAESILSAYFQSIRKNLPSIKRYYKPDALLRDQNLLELCEKLIIGIETILTIKLPLNSSLLNQWTIHPLQMAGILGSMTCQSMGRTGHLLGAITSGIDIVQTIGEDPDPDADADPDPGTEAAAADAATVPENADELTDELRMGNERKTTKQSPIIKNQNELIAKKNLNVIHEKYWKKNYDLTEDEYLKILLNRCDEMTIEKNRMTKDGIDEENNLIKNHQIGGNSILNKMNWSTTTTTTTTTTGDPTIADDGGLNDDGLIPKGSNDQDDDQEEDDDQETMTTTTTTTSFNNLLEKYNKNRNLHHLHQHEQLSTLQMENIWETFEKSTELLMLNDANNESKATTNDKEIVILNEEDENDDDDGDEDFIKNNHYFDFEILTKEFLNMPGKFTISELRQRIEQLCKIPNEFGLAAQNYVCFSCPNPLGIGFTIAHCCAFDGHYFCERCMHSELFSIPARILYNWDFRRYAVSQKSGDFLRAIENQPFLDLNLLNPGIFGAVDEMQTIQMLRKQLNFIRGYLFTCSETTIERFQKFLYAKEHLYEFVDRYTLTDLNGIKSGSGGGGGGGGGGGASGNLIQQLQKAVQFGRDHILMQCQLCSKKGFICEMCNDLNALYPFDIEGTFRCDGCGAIFHKNCLNARMPCPKCERKRKREDLPLLDAVYSRSPSPPLVAPVAHQPSSVAPLSASQPPESPPQIVDKFQVN